MQGGNCICNAYIEPPKPLVVRSELNIELSYDSRASFKVFLCQSLQGPDLRSLCYLVLVYKVRLRHMTTLPRHKSGGLTTFPDEVLSQVLKHLDLSTKLEAHTVCRQWNSVLSEPCCADLWTSVPEDRFSAETLTNPRKQDLERFVNWLADRAAGIPRISISTDQWTPVWQSTSNITEARFFIERQLPYLLGYLHCQNKHININLSTGDGNIACNPVCSQK